MSLIQQALKRKLDEEQGTAALPPPPLPPAPLATPPVSSSQLIAPTPAMTPPVGAPKISLAQPAVQSHKPPALSQQVVVEPEPKGSPARAFVIVLILLLAGVAVWYFRFYKQPGSGAGVATIEKWTPTKPVSGITKSVSAPSVAKSAPEKKYTQVPSIVPLPNIGAVHEKVDKMKEAIRDFRTEGSDATGIKPPDIAPPKVEPTPVVATPTPEPVLVKPVPVTPPPVPAPAPVAVAPAVPVAPVAPVVWPAVKITGVMATSQKDHRTAFINDSLLNVGDSVDGMILIDVAQNSVMLEFKGDRRSFPVGRRH